MIARTFVVAVVAFCLGFAAHLAVSRISCLRTEVDADVSEHRTSATATAGNPHEDSRAESPVQRKELLRAPGFDDVSAFDDGDISRVDAWLQEQVDPAQYPSLSVAVVRDGEIAYLGDFGFEDIKARRKATPQTSYHVASVTKAFTASLAVMLHVRGVTQVAST